MSASAPAREALRRWLATGAAVPAPRGDAEAAGLVAAAFEQGVSGLLHAELVRRPDGWPGAAVAALRAAHHAALARGVAQLDAAARVHRLLRARGLRSLPLKGAALAERLYDTVADRPMADVDVLVLDDWPEALRAMRDAGFAKAEAADHAWSFVDPASGTIVELHHSVTSSPGLFPADPDGLWSRSVAADGQVERVPSVEDLLVHLSLHAAFQHGLVLTLVQFVDFQRAFERAGPRPERLLAAAAAVGALGSLSAALLAAEAAVGLRLPDSLAGELERLLPRGLRGRLAEARRNPLLLIAPAVPALGRVRWALAAGRRLRLVLGTLVPREPGRPRRFHRALLRAGTLAWRWGPLAHRG
jgi:hypothetical protein